MSIETEIAALRASYDGHVKNDDERYTRIESNTSQIMAMLTEVGRKLDESISRVHSRIDEESAKTRHAVNNASMVADSRVLLVQKQVDDSEQALSTLQIRCLAGAIVGLLTVVAFFVAPFFLHGP